MVDDLKSPFDPDGGKFAENIRSIKGDDTELRESMRRLKWLKHLPAFTDENGVLLVGHRRMKIAKEENIKPVIVQLTLGKGDAGDTKRFQLAVASNTGSKAQTKNDRKRIAEHLYTKQNWSQQAIAEALNVSQSTIRDDLSTLVGATNVKGQGKDTRGRTKSTGRPRQADLKPHYKKEEISAKVDEGKTLAEIAAETGVSERTARRVAEVHKIERAAKADPDIDRSMLSMTAQEKFDTAVRQHMKKLDSEFHQRVNARVKEFVDETILPDWKKKITEAHKLFDKRKALMDKDTFNTIRRALHPDSRMSISDKRLAEAFDAFMALEKYLLDEKDSPTLFGETMPMSFDTAAKQKAAEARRAKRSNSHSQLRPRP